MSLLFYHDNSDAKHCLGEFGDDGQGWCPLYQTRVYCHVPVWCSTAVAFRQLHSSSTAISQVSCLAVLL